MLEPGDRCTAKTSRKVKKETNGGSVIVNLVKFVLQVEVTKVEYAMGDAVMRIGGKAVSNCEHISTGQHHSLELGVNDTVTIVKDLWDYNCRRVLRQAMDPKASADVGALLVASGSAKLYLISEEQVRSRGSLSKLRGNQKSYESMLLAMSSAFDLTKLKSLVIAGHQQDARDFAEWIFDTTTKTAVKQPSLNKYKEELRGKRKQFVVTTSKGIEQSDLREVLENSEEKLGHAKVVTEVQAFKEFDKAQLEGRAVYGLAQVIAADECGAISKLIISNQLLKGVETPSGVDPVTARRYLSALAQRCDRQAPEKSAAFVTVISASSLMYEEVQKMASVGAILKYPILDLEFSTDVDTMNRKMREAG